MDFMTDDKTREAWLRWFEACEEEMYRYYPDEEVWDLLYILGFRTDRLGRPN